jgi:hypothetical protein
MSEHVAGIDWDACFTRGAGVCRCRTFGSTTALDAGVCG